MGKLAYNSDIELLKTSVSEGKKLIAAAVTDKGVETAADAEFKAMADNIRSLDIKTDLDVALSNATSYTCDWTDRSDYTDAVPVTPGDTFKVTESGKSWSLHIETSGSVRRGAAMCLYGTKGIDSRNGKVIYNAAFNPTTNILTISAWFAYNYEQDNFNITYAASGTVTVLGIGTYTTRNGGTARGVKMRINKKTTSDGISWNDFDFWAFTPDAYITTITQETTYTLPPTNWVFK